MSPTASDQGLQPLEILYAASDLEAGPTRGAPMPPELVALHGGPFSLPLRPDRPTIVANFVATLDGVVALDRAGVTGGGEISGFSKADRFQMGLLRALADVVLVAAGTVRAAPTHEWAPRRVARAQAPLLEAWRVGLGLAPQPTTVIVTGTGRLDPAHPGLSAPDVPVVVASAPSGADHLAQRPFARHVRVEVLGVGNAVGSEDLLALFGRLGARIVVCEGGPHLFAQLLAAGLVDELFLSLAPQLVGRAPDHPRLGLVEGLTFERDQAPWGTLRSVHRAGGLLLLRLGFG
ncbi:MAG: dihydrofolate reductase family protein [Candidatus Limnocylindrales bacterium]